MNDGGFSFQDILSLSKILVPVGILVLIYITFFNLISIESRRRRQLR